jgi:coenzyme PQQ synthesis protein D (PqqD)
MTSSRHKVSPETIDQDFVARRGPAVHTVEVDGEAVLLNEGRLHLLNATGALVWACFDGDGTIAEIAADLSEGLGVSYETVLEDTLAVARHLGEEGLLDTVTPLATEDNGLATEDTPADEAASQWRTDPRFVDEPPNT